MSVDVLDPASDQVAETRVYTAVFRRDPKASRYWLAELAEDSHVHTFGRSIGEALQHLEDATRLWYQLPPDQSVNLRLRLGEEVDAELDAAESLSQRAADLQRQVATTLQQTALRLTEEFEFSRREVGAILGVSHQRVQQLLEAVRTARVKENVHPYKAARSRARKTSVAANINRTLDTKASSRGS